MILFLRVFIFDNHFNRLYPEGQMSLALDRSPTANPTTGFGRFYTEVLQVFYVTYYVWGYLPILILGYRYIVAWRKLDGNAVNHNLAQMKLYLCGWLSAFFLVFICNTSLPALSPRLYFKNEYIHPRLEGFGLAKRLIGVATDDASFGSFPSGHFGESMISGIYLLQINKPVGILVVVSSAMIGIATQALRYHYFTDLLGAAAVVLISLTYGFCITPGIFRRETARIAASYVAQTGASVSYNDIEANSTELGIRTSDDGSSAGDEYSDATSTDLESGPLETTGNSLVHALI
jgi:membrane-associated phospholipid phosphatase